ncbi:hypothetical protein ACIBHX_43475 [Nonomuraea sp. NPDC050536]|uniref:hypothetical protein n=1 Tax=Nonomuraea sp. NPDC050536 TaxID=3364366 RepID=UPI0037CA0CFD
MVAAERALTEDDPDAAHEHTKVARRFAARIGVVREAAGIVAYRAGHFSEALSDLRAARRMTGSDAYLPIMADCERGLGRPERALDLVRSPEAERLDRPGRIELTIVESGARRDLGQHDAAVITLQRLPELRDPQPRPWSARLAFAYADALADAGHQDAATDWFSRAMAFDEEGETEAAERYAELTGAVIEDVEEEFEAFDADDFDDDILVGSAAIAPTQAADSASTDEAAASDVEDDEADAEAESSEAEAEPESSEVDAEAESFEVDAESGSAEFAAEAESAEAEIAEADDEAKPGEDEPIEAKPAEIKLAEEVAITPAFIEPDFGDILDQPDEESPKRQD